MSPEWTPHQVRGDTVEETIDTSDPTSDEQLALPSASYSKFPRIKFTVPFVKNTAKLTAVPIKNQANVPLSTNLNTSKASKS